MPRCLLSIARLVTVFVVGVPSALSALPPAVTEVTGQVVDQMHQPLGNATVSLVELGRSTTTSADGHFRFAAVPAGHYTVTVRRLGYVTASQQIVVDAATVTVN